MFHVCLKFPFFHDTLTSVELSSLFQYMSDAIAVAERRIVCHAHTHLCLPIHACWIGTTCFLFCVISSSWCHPNCLLTWTQCSLFCLRYSLPCKLHPLGIHLPQYVLSEAFLRTFERSTPNTIVFSGGPQYYFRWIP